jgi:predicted NAD/FAD-dependent oxidoreductase
MTRKSLIALLITLALAAAGGPATAARGDLVRSAAAPVPLQLAIADELASAGCTLAAPDLTALHLWRRYAHPTDANLVMIPQAFVGVVDALGSACSGVLRVKTYVVELPGVAEQG